MIELYAIYKFCKLFGRQLRAKGREPAGFQLLLVILWFVFEAMGAVVGATLTRSPGGVYLFALLGACGAVAVVYQVIRGLPDKNGPRLTRGFPVESGLASEESLQKQARSQDNDFQ